MEWRLRSVRDADMEIPSANYPGIRFIRIKPEGSPEAREDFHNAQFLQLLGLSTNSNPSTEPRARDLRSCVRPGTAATETLYAYAEERLREEVDVTVTHERLDDALRMTSAELG